MPVTVFTVEASIVPPAAASRVFNADAETETSLIVPPTVVPKVIPVAPRVLVMSAADPVKDVTVFASIVPDVLPSRVVSVEAASEVSVNVTASFPSPDIPDDA